jgi:hypothetical protein
MDRTVTTDEFGNLSFENSLGKFDIKNGVVLVPTNFYYSQMADKGWNVISVRSDGRVSAYRDRPEKTSDKLGSLAGRIMAGYEPTRSEIVSMAASLLTQVSDK